MGAISTNMCGGIFIHVFYAYVEFSLLLCVCERWCVWRGSLESQTQPAPSAAAKRLPRSQQNNQVQLNLSLQIDPKNN